MGDPSELVSWCKKIIGKYWLTLVFFLGLVLSVPKFLLVFGFLVSTDLTKSIVDASFTVAQTLLASGVFAAISKSIFFRNIFLRDFEDVFYGERHLNDQNEEWLKDVWKRISGAMYHQKFPAISDKIHDNIMRAYLPSDDMFYYKDYNMSISIKRCDCRPGYVEVTEEICATVKEIALDARYTIKRVHYNDETGEPGEFKLENLEFNDIKQKAEFIKSEGFDDELKCKYSLAKLDIPFPKGLRECKVKRCIKEIYPLISYNKGMRVNFTRFVDGVHVNIVYDTEPFVIEFSTYGTLDNFESLSNYTSQFIEKKYDGVIFPSQGFMIFLDERKNFG